MASTPTTRIILNAVAKEIERERSLSPRQAKAFVHDSMPFDELVRRSQRYTVGSTAY